MNVNNMCSFRMQLKKIIDGHERLVIFEAEELKTIFEEMQSRYDIQDVLNEAEVVGFPLKDYSEQEIRDIAKLYRERLDNSAHWPAVARSAIRDVLNVQI